MMKLLARLMVFLLLVNGTVVWLACAVGMHQRAPEIAFLATSDFNTWLYLVDVDHGLGYRLANAPVINQDYAWSPDGARLAFISYVADSTEVFTVGADGRRLRELTIGEPQEYYPAWSPDSRYLVFSRQSIDPTVFPDLVVMDTTDRSERLLTNSPEVESSPQWSPDGRHIAFIEHYVSLNTIRIVDAETGEQRAAMNELSGSLADLSWSPDGTRLVFTVYSHVGYIGLTNTGMIYVMDIGANRIYQLTDPDQSSYSPAWSPDGTQIVYASQNSSGSGIYVMNADGSDQQLLAQQAQEISGVPVWSPDGTQIVFAANYAPAGSSVLTSYMYVMNADGSNLRRVDTTMNLSDWLPRWRP